MAERFIYTTEGSNEIPDDAEYTAQDVNIWQNYLKSKGHQLQVDGIYGPITKKYTEKELGQPIVDKQNFKSAFNKFPPMKPGNIMPSKTVLPAWEDLPDLSHFYDSSTKTYCVVLETEFKDISSFKQSVDQRAATWRSEAFSYLVLEFGKSFSLTAYKAGLYLDPAFKRIGLADASGEVTTDPESPPVVAFEYSEEESKPKEFRLQTRPGSSIKVLIRVSAPHFNAIPGASSSKEQFEEEKDEAINWLEYSSEEWDKNLSAILRALKHVDENI